MARRFLRPSLSNKIGDVYRGARLHVYEHGTTTEVDCYAAETGGPVLTQPLVTNAKGQVQTWADSSGELDLAWTDTGNTYLPNGQRTSFSDFTEFVPAESEVDFATVSAALDVALAEEAIIISDLFGGTLNLGTSGAAKMRWQRVGRMVDAWFYFSANTDWSSAGGPWIVPYAELPYTPRATPTNPVPGGDPFGAPSGFGYVAYGVSTPSFLATPGVVPTFAALAFTTPSAAGGLSNFWSGTNPDPLTGQRWIYQGFLRYEAASAL